MTREELAEDFRRLKNAISKPEELIKQIDIKDTEKLKKIITYASELAITKARDDFLVFRQIARGIHQPNAPFYYNDYIKITAQAFQSFYYKTIIGENPLLMLQTPVQHGKSIMAIDFLAWLLGKNPNLRLLFASFSENLGIRANLALQRIITHPTYAKIFPETQIYTKDSAVKKTRNQHFLEMLNHTGSFRNTTVGGQINGESVDIGLIDDVIKGRTEAISASNTEKQRDWYFGNFLTRLQGRFSGHIIIGTPWEKHDLLGTILEMNKNNPHFTYLKFPVLAGENDLFRKPNEPLLPQLRDIKYLEHIQSKIDTRTWESLWMCNPIIEGGEVFEVGKIEYYSRQDFEKMKFEKIFITMDTAEKIAEHNDYSVLALWGVNSAKELFLIDMLRGKWTFNDLLVQAEIFVRSHTGHPIGLNGVLTKIIIEEKSSGTALISMLKRAIKKIPIIAVQPKGNKVSRAYAVSHYVAHGKVFLPNFKSSIIEPFVLELTEFSMDNGHRHDDMVDCLVYAIEEIIVKQPTFVGFSPSVNFS